VHGARLPPRRNTETPFLQGSGSTGPPLESQPAAPESRRTSGPGREPIHVHRAHGQREHAGAIPASSTAAASKNKRFAATSTQSLSGTGPCHAIDSFACGMNVNG